MFEVIVLTLGVLSGLPPTQAIPRNSADPVSFTLRMSGDRTRFHPGEVIPIELEFSTAIPNRYVLDNATYDRSGRLTLDEFRITPIADVSDPVLDMFAASGGSIGGGLRGMPVLGPEPTVVKQQLNEWFRFDRPGTFRLSVRSSRVTDEAVAGTRSVLSLDSNTITFEIVPFDAGWAGSTVAAAVRLLDATEPVDDRRDGCRLLRYLGTDAAADEMVARYDDGRWSCQFDYMAGLFSAPNRERVVRQMEAAVTRGDRAVSASFLQTLARLSVYLTHPEYRPAQTAETMGKLPPPGELALHRALVDAEIDRHRARLLAALPGKTGAARAITLADHFASAGNRTASPAEEEELRRQLAASFLELPSDRQLGLLQYSWSRLRNPDMLPVLRRLVENGPVLNQPSGDVALRRLYELAPDEGRAVILRAIAAPRSGMTLKTLGILEDRELPALDDRLAANIESASGFEDSSIRAELLQRYASPAVASRVLASVRGKLDALACQPKAALLAYFLRVDPTLGAELVNAALAAREQTGCYRALLMDLARLRMTPELQSAAIAHLADPAAQVVATAAEMLGRYGSPAAVAPLRAGFERWHAAWAARADDMRLHVTQPPEVREQTTVEAGFFAALASGQGWLTGRRDIETLRALCVSDNCRSNADGMFEAAAGTEIQVVVLDGDSASVSIAQYHLESIADLERKLAQYPAGASFHLTVWAPSPVHATVVERINQVARAHGIAIQ